mmetsp:Transcript_48482/g.154864  ORF Transcript_48482/g.154864 Transcript_48482/m.154864 type:complete len:387 (-) Transcript_48482:193-1353(-)
MLAAEAAARDLCLNGEGQATSAQIESLKVRILSAWTPEEIASLWLEMEQLRSSVQREIERLRAPAVPAPAFPAPSLPPRKLSPPPPQGPPAEAEALQVGSRTTGSRHSWSTSAGGSSAGGSSCSDDGEEATPTPGESSDCSGAVVVIKNTFIEARFEQDPWLCGFFRERQVRSCPASRASSVGAPAGRSAHRSLDLAVAAARLQLQAASAPATPTAALEAAATQGSGASVFAAAEPEVLSAQGLAIASLVAAMEQWAPATQGLATGVPLAAAATSVAVPLSRGQRGAQQGPVLRLADALEWAGPSGKGSSAWGAAALPSPGSAKHHLGQCRPCAFAHTKGCSSGRDCRFCHICGPHALKERRRQVRTRLRLGTPTAGNCSGVTQPR